MKNPSLKTIALNKRRTTPDEVVTLKKKHVKILSKSTTPLKYSIFLEDVNVKQLLLKMYPHLSKEEAHREFLQRKHCTENYPRLIFKGQSSIGLEDIHDTRPKFKSFNDTVVFIMKRHQTTEMRWNAFWEEAFELNGVTHRIKEIYDTKNVTVFLKHMRGVKDSVFKMSYKKDFVRLRSECQHLIQE